MSSLAPGYAFDIFISYRQKDNKYDGWVTEFVNNLKRELESTFKGTISIYFDENPEDGLHEMHDVDESLKDKIRTLVFIPIVSRTYCDESSFAWRKEFLAFRDFASSDALGLKVRLANGNVTSRILPIRIHDIDAEDVQLFEKETGSPLRPIDFIFKSAGVNRPLLPTDDRKDNQTHIYYRDQINKVAMTLKEITAAARHREIQPARRESISASGYRPSSSNKKFIVGAIIMAVLAVVGYAAFAYWKGNVLISEPAKAAEESIDRSIAVLPFADMSANKDQEYFGDGLSEELLNLLAKVPELTVISRTSAFSFKGKNEDIRTIGEKLNVAYLLEGSVRKDGEKLRITTQLIRANDGSHVWSENYDRDMKNIFEVQDEIANAVVTQLKVKLLGNHIMPKESKPEVYNLWMQSRYYTLKLNRNKALEFAKLATEKDSTDARAWSQLARSYWSISNNSVSVEQGKQAGELGKQAAAKAIRLDPNLADGYREMGRLTWNAFDIAEVEAAAKYCQKALALDSSSTNFEYLARILSDLGDHKKAKVLLQKAMRIDPLFSASYQTYATQLMLEGKNQESAQYAKKAIELGSGPAYQTIIMAELLLNNPKEALTYIQFIDDAYWTDFWKIICFWSNGQKEESRTILKKFEKENYEIGPFQIAQIYTWYGENDKAFEWIEKSFQYKDPGLTEIHSIPIMRLLEKDSRYEAVIKRLNFPTQTL